jgi:tagatose-6-phosphate ketose/aldose isomerase
MLLATQLALDPDNAGIDAIDALGEAADRLLADRADDLRELAARRYQRVVYLGSGALTGLAREGALKLLELTAGQIVSYWDSSLGFRHGPKAVLSEGTLAVVFVSPDPYTRRYDDDIAVELRRALGSEHVIAVTSHPDASRDSAAWQLGDFDKVPDVFVALPYAVLAQQFAMLCSLELGHTPDNPFPSGELNRVVRGVQIYPVSEHT